MFVLASIDGGLPLTLSVAGTAVRSGNTVQFQQREEPSVRDLPVTLGGNTLRTNQAISGTTFAVTLARQ